MFYDKVKAVLQIKKDTQVGVFFMAGVVRLELTARGFGDNVV